MPPPKDPKKREEWLQRQRDSHLGKPSAFKGKTHTDESKELNRQAHIGRVHTEEELFKMRNSHKGQVPWNAGKTGIYSEERIEGLRKQMIGNKHAQGLKHTEEWKETRSLETTGEKNPFYGREHLDSSKLAVSKANTGKPSPMKDKHHTEETRALLKITRSHQVFPREDSKPEKILQIALALENVKYTKHPPLKGQPDIFIEPNVCIFVDGDYWHANPNRFRPEDRLTSEMLARDRWKIDQEITNHLIKQGNKVLRIWESSIKKDVKSQVDFIQNFLKIQESLPLLS